MILHLVAGAAPWALGLAGHHHGLSLTAGAALFHAAAAAVLTLLLVRAERLLAVLSCARALVASLLARGGARRRRECLPPPVPGGGAVPPSIHPAIVPWSSRSCPAPGTTHRSHDGKDPMHHYSTRFRRMLAGSIAAAALLGAAAGCGGGDDGRGEHHRHRRGRHRADRRAPAHRQQLRERHVPGPGLGLRRALVRQLGVAAPAEAQRHRAVARGVGHQQSPTVWRIKLRPGLKFQNGHRARREGAGRLLQDRLEEGQGGQGPDGQPDRARGWSTTARWT